MSKPTLSVIVPNYNHARYLPECLGSLMRQTLPPDEIIAVDDCSTDNSLEVLRSANMGNLKILRNPANMGTVLTLNRGIRAATGKYIILFAADDLLLPTYCEKAVALLEQYPEAGLCFCDPASFNGPSGRAPGKVNENRLRLSASPRYFSPEELVSLARRQRLLISGAAVFRGALIKKYLPELKWHSDFFACFTTAFCRGACYIPEPLARWRARHDSFMSVGVKAKGKQEAVILTLLSRLAAGDPHTRERFERSGVLAFIPGAWRVILSRREYWPFLNWALLRWAVPVDIFWHLPSWLQRALRSRRST